ncbi:MAG TPA: serine hydrolase [Actinomycetota bacterium]|nr:serine hydrolase [Actinomycetota bacterium]
MRVRATAVIVASSLAVGTAGPAFAQEAWEPDLAAAKAFARSREGRVRFAVVDETGGKHRWRAWESVPMASVFKVMLMVGYLRRPSVRDRDLRRRDRRLLSPMIRRSDNATATRIVGVLGGRRLRRLARAAGMRDFRFVRSPWGMSRSSARDQAKFMSRLEELIPDRHEEYARTLLRTIVSSQRWGIPRVTPEGWTPYFKGGWGSGTGKVVHQVAFLENGDRRISIAIFITNSPSHRYGTRTLRGVARRLLRGLGESVAPAA